MDNTKAKTHKSRYNKPHKNDYAMITRWPQLNAANEVQLDFKNSHKGNILLPVQLMRKCGLLLEKGVSIAVFNNRFLIRNTKSGKRFYQEENKNFTLKRTGLPIQTLNGPIAWVMGDGFLIGTTHEDAAALAPNAQFFERERITRIKYDKCVDDYMAAYPLDSLKIIGWKDSKLFNSARDTQVAAVAGHLWDYAGFVPGDPLCISRYPNCTVVEKWCESSGTPAPHSVLRVKRKSPSHYFGVKTVHIEGATAVRVIAGENKLILTNPASDIANLCTMDKHSKFPPINYRGAGFGKELPEYDDTNLIVNKEYTKKCSKDNLLRIARGVLVRSGIPAESPVIQTRYNGVIVLTRPAPGATEKLSLINRKQGIAINLARAKFPDGGAAQIFAADGYVVVAPAGVMLGKMATHPVNEQKSKSKGSQLPLISTGGELALEAAQINYWADFEVFNNAVIIRGPFLARGGFEFIPHARISQYENAVCIDACGEADATITFGTKAAALKYRIINLKNSLFAAATTVRGIMANGRLILVDPWSVVGRKCSEAPLFTLPPLSSKTAQKRTLNAVASSSKLKKRSVHRKAVA